MGFPSAVLLRQGQSITGSFNRLQVMASGSVVTAGGSAFAVGHISALRDGNSDLLVNSGSAIFLPCSRICRRQRSLQFHLQQQIRRETCLIPIQTDSKGDKIPTRGPGDLTQRHKARKHHDVKRIYECFFDGPSDP
jgi:hypothetical protein